MSEKNKSISSLRKLVVTSMAALALTSMEGCTNEKGDRSPSRPNGQYNLDTHQIERLNRIARLGSGGRSGYVSLLYADGKYFTGRRSHGPKNRPSTDDFVIGGTLRLDSIVELTKLTVDAEDGRSTVTYHHIFDNLNYGSDVRQVLGNPDPEFFGTDRVVSVNEMDAFFKDSKTQLVSASVETDTRGVADCTSVVTLDEGVVTYSDDNNVECPPVFTTNKQLMHYVVHNVIG